MKDVFFKEAIFEFLAFNKRRNIAINAFFVCLCFV